MLQRKGKHFCNDGGETESHSGWLQGSLKTPRRTVGGPGEESEEKKGRLEDGDGMRGVWVCVCTQINVDVFERGERQAG